METYWEQTDNGIRRRADAPFGDHVEMAGHQLAAIVTYGKHEDGTLQLCRELCYPRLRTRPRDTFGTLHARHGEEQRQRWRVDGAAAEEYPEEFIFDGVLTTVSYDQKRQLRITRHCFPCAETAAYIEQVTTENLTSAPLSVAAEAVDATAYVRGASGVYALLAQCPALDTVLAPGEALVSALVCSAQPHRLPPPTPDCAAELSARRALVQQLTAGSLVLDCPDRELVQFFRLAKLRASESIFDTAAGPLHSPGGGPYYAAVWANDEAEYAGPFFPFMGYERANLASRNAYALFGRFMSPDGAPIPSSIIDEGRDSWDDQGDRGDAAMVLYGCSRYLLALGDRELAQEMFWMLRWTADYTLSKKTPEGVIASDTDELEGRLPAGDANLSTSCLAYGGLLSAAALARDPGEAETARVWTAEALSLRHAIENYFGAGVSGYRTYRYYDGNTTLRSWICIPLTMDIFDRQEGTTDALLSDRLFRDDGVLSVEGDATFWDRSTLYAFRGILRAGGSDRVYPFIRRYVTQRLRGAHVPYAVEAFPEGDQRHLSAESALFARVITEGLCGITPVGLHRLELRPSVPEALGWVTLRDIRAGGGSFDLTITRQSEGHTVVITADGRQTERFIPLGEAYVWER